MSIDDKSAVVTPTANNATWQPPSQIHLERPGRRKSKLTPGMVAQLKVVGGAVWSPDGKYLYYPQDFNGSCQIYRLEVGTGNTLQLSSDVEAGALLAVSQKAFDVSPDGSKIVYLGGKDGKLYLLPNTGGPVTPLTGYSEGGQSSAVFSPDGKQVAFVAVLPEKQYVAVADSNAGSWPRPVSNGEAFVFDPQWFPDGKQIVYGEYDTHAMPFSGTRLVITNLESGQSRIVADGWAEGFMYQHPRVSPDGKWLAYLSDETNWANIWLLNLESGERIHFSPEQHEQGEPTWTPDSQRIVFTRNHACSITLHVATLDGKIETLDDEQGVISGLIISPDGESVCYVKQSSIRPSNLYAQSLLGGSVPQRLSNNTVGGLEQANLVQPEVVHWFGSDGLEIEGLLYLPSNFEPGKHPALVNIHGGPIAQYNRSWQGVVQYLVGRGWLVIQPNFRGSTGYSREFRRALNGTWGDLDMLDNLGAVDYLKNQQLCDPNRIVAWGGSGGGYATMLLLSKWPDVFKAGVALVGVSNFVSFPEQTDRFARYLMHSILGPRADNATIFEERSPVTFAHQIKAPLLMLMGEKDYRVPAVQGDEMVEALKKAGITNFEYHVYPGEGHGWRKVESNLDYMRRMDAFLEKWVLER